MTGRLRAPLLHPSRTAAAAAAAMAVSASLLSGCGALPGGTADSSKDPVTVMTWAPEGTHATNMPGMPAMAQAYARWINAQGGINGHPLKVLTCNDHNRSIRAARCARKAVNAKVAAVVGSYSQHGRAFVSPLEAAGIPYIGGYGISDEEFNSPLSYPVNGGQATLLAGSGRQLARQCERVSLVRPDTIAGDQLPGLLNSGLVQGERSPAKDVRAPEDATEYTRQAQLALSGVGADSDRLGTPGYNAKAAGGCVTAALGDRTDTFFDSFRRLQRDNHQVGIASIVGSIQQSLVDRTGGKASPLEGALATSWYPAADDARWSPMRKVIREQAFSDNRVDPADPGVQTTWIAYTALRQVIESLGDDEISPRTISQALDRGTTVDTGGLTPTLSWRHGDMLAVQDFPRIVNAMVTFQVVRNGQLVAVRKGSVNVGETLEEHRQEG
ncbi:ABC transporter substrate-binding protein [Streptomyces sp. H27-D2]|uniref:ABC transporter substrate-binding protein n=1 Tax=Streptomyces sp. H27-D2 TaxID=3046304 RepID=UPI002DB719EF|nr:ABC transporter substrate-binding protein [Streptomyces sp. H27-D2]MEC4016806.1 ABC transporter substrate-binding protein [Streptomyces sp. H27-D2]